MQGMLHEGAAGILDEPSRLWNADETGICTARKVLAHRGTREVRKIAGEITSQCWGLVLLMVSGCLHTSCIKVSIFMQGGRRVNLAWRQQEWLDGGRLVSPVFH